MRLDLGLNLGIHNRLNAPSAWTPADLTGLALWLDADDAGTITLNGSTVSQWEDKSGNNYHVSQASGALQPRYVAAGLNGKPALNNEDGRYLQRGTTPMFRNVAGATIVVVYQPTLPLAGAAPNGMVVFVNNGAAAGWNAAWPHAYAQPRHSGDVFHRGAEAGCRQLRNGAIPYIIDG
jgi:hypothetical protein